MTSYILQINPEKEFRISDALQTMRRERISTIVLSDKPGGRNPHPEFGNTLYLWQAKKGGGFVARGVVENPSRIGVFRAMPEWQRVFCIDPQGVAGPHAYQPDWPRAEIAINRFADFGALLGRSIATSNPILSISTFWQPNGSRGTVFRLSEQEAQEIDRLHQW